MTERFPIIAKSMVRIFVSGMGRCLPIILFIVVLLAICPENGIANDMKGYQFPKGIVLNAGQYPSTVHAYAHLGKSIIWFDSEGLLFDARSSSGRHTIRMKFPSQHLSISTEVIIQERNVITGKGVSKEEFLQSFTILDEDGKNVSTFLMNDNGLQWIIDSNPQEVEYMIDGADSISIDEVRGLLYLHAGTTCIAMHAPLFKNAHGELK